MSIKNILILGDSTSMTIGCYEYTFPFILSNHRIWRKESTIYNSSLHGFGSADALKFLKKNNIKDLDYIILNIGICDSIATEVQKKSNQLNLFTKKKSLNTNKIIFNDWNNNFDNLIHKPETERDFEKNIKKIINFANSKKIKIIIIVPDSNYFFHPGLAKGNFAYYSYYNLLDKSSNFLNFKHDKLKKAFQLAEEGEYKKCNELYLQILNDKISFNYSFELYYAIANNYAVNEAKLGNYQVSLKNLKILSKEENIRKEIIFYNISIIYKKINEKSKSDKYLLLSNDEDINNYKINENFRNIIKKIVSNFSLDSIDIRSLENKNFFDHCHLTKSGHLELSNKLSNILNNGEIVDSYRAKIKNILFNPEYSLGNDKNFNEYFQIQSEKKIDLKNQVQNINLKANNNGSQSIEILSGVDDELFDAIESYNKHPIFVHINFLKNIDNYKNFYYGKFPELFIITICQHIFNFLHLHNSFDGLTIDGNLFLDKEKRENIFKNLNLTNDLDSIFNFKNIDIKDCLNKIKDKISFHMNKLPKENQIYDRRKFTMYWYFRESIKFGTQSRNSMFYNFIELQNIYEAAVLSIGLSKYIQSKQINYFENIKLKIEQISKLNEKFIISNESSLKFFQSFDLNNYKNNLNKIIN